MSLYREPEDLQEFVDEWIADPQATTVKRMRNLTGWGMMECKSYLDKAAFVYNINNAKDFETLRKLVSQLASMSNWKLR